MEIQIKPDDIDIYVKEAILKSTFGSRIIDALAKDVGDWKYNDIIKQTVERVLSDIIREILSSPEKHSIIRKAVEDTVTDELIKKVAGESLQKLFSRY